ncbi:hypothetical protein PYW07_003191 [Mythimna separata]|uniref:Peptidase S1 domain-containing protein n=1 Tax=Mythimna separata TaxID=271217 RepID=A0AAD7YI97_MYTSE|nr:hypothetical protein PYW07_003191 [Mythimna separata]
MQVVAGTLHSVSTLHFDGQWRALKKVLYPATFEFPNDDIAVIDHYPVLVLAHLTVVPNEICRPRLTPNLVYTSTELTRIVKGDSGGPLVCAETGDPNEGERGVLVGISCAAKAHRCSVFTRISQYQSFINSVNSVFIPMYKYNMQSCTTITIATIYKEFAVYVH